MADSRYVRDAFDSKVRSIQNPSHGERQRFPVADGFAIEVFADAHVARATYLRFMRLEIDWVVSKPKPPKLAT